jgi:hypothetical protein
MSIFGENKSNSADGLALLPSVDAARRIPMDAVASIASNSAKERTIAQLKVMTEYGTQSLTINRTAKVYFLLQAYSLYVSYAALVISAACFNYFACFYAGTKLLPAGTAYKRLNKFQSTHGRQNSS